MILFSGMPGLPWIILGLVAPTALAIIGLSYGLTYSFWQRLAFMLTGLTGSLFAVFAYIITVNLRYKRAPNDEESMFVFVLAPIGAILSIGLAWCLHKLARQLAKKRHRRTT